MLENLEQVFLPNTVMHIEDEDGGIRSSFQTLAGKRSNLRDVLTPPIIQVVSDVKEEIPDDLLEAEIQRLYDAIRGKSSILYVRTAQIARTFLTTKLPAGIISDTGFPLNGAKIVQWFLTHGLGDFPLIGFSGTDLDRLDRKVQDYFMTSNARYFLKGDPESLDALPIQLTYNIGYTRQTYAHLKRE